MFRRFLFSRIWSSTQDHAVLVLLLSLVGFFISTWQKSVRRKWFVLAVYQFRKGISAGLALQYFTWFIGAGGFHVCDIAKNIRVTWRIHMCDMTPSSVWHDAFMCVTFMCVTLHIHTCDMTHSYVWYDAFICVTWHFHVCGFHVCDIAYSSVWHDAFICVTWHLQPLWHDAFLFVAFMCVTLRIHMCAMTFSQARQPCKARL